MSLSNWTDLYLIITKKAIELVITTVLLQIAGLKPFVSVAFFS